MKGLNVDQQRIHDALVKESVDKGLLIEAGFASLRHFAIAKDAPLDQVAEMRMAFMAGAQHVYSSIMTMMDGGEEPTEADMRRMAAIDKELEEFGKQLTLRLATVGRAQ